MKKFKYLEPIICDSFIGEDAELKTRGICPYCERYLLDDGRCECERPVFKRKKKPKLRLVKHCSQYGQESKAVGKVG